jgi:hypothetical protein
LGSIKLIVSGQSRFSHQFEVSNYGSSNAKSIKFTVYLEDPSNKGSYNIFASGSIDGKAKSTFKNRGSDIVYGKYGYQLENGKGNFLEPNGLGYVEITAVYPDGEEKARRSQQIIFTQGATSIYYI